MLKFDDYNWNYIDECLFDSYKESIVEFFELLGIDTDRLVWVDKITKFRKIHIPDVSMVAMDYYTNEYAKIFEKIRSGISKAINSKFHKLILIIQTKCQIL